MQSSAYGASKCDERAMSAAATGMAGIFLSNPVDEHADPQAELATAQVERIDRRRRGRGVGQAFHQRAVGQVLLDGIAGYLNQAEALQRGCPVSVGAVD